MRASAIAGRLDAYTVTAPRMRALRHLLRRWYRRDHR